ncbi:MAG: DUF3576 domain-containing protein [Paracoccaceae bacterium]|nr:DUF3576 domain-containing protein [Paracoccaceae bacterium]
MKKQLILALVCGAVLAGCGSDSPQDKARRKAAAEVQHQNIPEEFRTEDRSTIWELFDSPDPGTTFRVNKYLWQAALETLEFMPLEKADPFHGTLIYGWGRAPGARTEYRMTVLVSDPALDARSLNLSILTRNGPAAAATVESVENAILTRARQLWRDDPARSG